MLNFYEDKRLMNVAFNMFEHWFKTWQIRAWPLASNRISFLMQRVTLGSENIYTNLPSEHGAFFNK